MDLTLERIYGWREMSTAIVRSVLKELHLSCTKSVQFTFDDSIYLQYVGVAMGSIFIRYCFGWYCNVWTGN